jgi:putative flippase GtrA
VSPARTARTASSLASTIVQRRGVRQLVKFSLVGASSTVLDKGSLYLLVSRIIPSIPWWISASMSFGLGVTNSFLWNRHWTFRARDHASAKEQYGRFLATNVVGLSLNLVMTKLLLVVVTGHPWRVGENPPPYDVLVASLLAVPCVTLWNFAASKYWAFREPS